MTDDEIIKALECCKMDDCDNCPNGFGNCYSNLAGYALSLINRQKTEIERLQNDLAQTEDAYKTVHEMNGAYARKIDFAKAEAIKEFAERLEDKLGNTDLAIHFVDNLVKEMVGEDK